MDSRQISEDDFDPLLRSEDGGGLVDDDDFDQDPNMTEAEKEKKRQEKLERNREIARNCRKRKRAKIEGLEEEVNTLRDANRVLELQLKVARNRLGLATTGRGNRGKEEEAKRLKEVKEMNELAVQRVSDDEVVQRLQRYTETYADFGEEREQLIKVHLDQLEQLLLPTQVSKMLLWILKQDDDFYSDDDPESIWNMIATHLDLDPKQRELIKEQRSHLGLQNTSMKRCLKMLRTFEAEVRNNWAIRRKQMDQMMKLITPVQIVKFLQWVEDNQACIHMLNGLWPVNPERQDSKRSESE